MNPTLRLWLGTIVAAIVSLLAAFFVVFNAVFSDVFGFRERLLTFVYVAAAYMIIAFVCGLAGPAHAKRWAWILATPALLILALYSLSERSGILVHIIIGAIATLAAHIGAQAGSRARQSRLKQP